MARTRVDRFLDLPEVQRTTRLTRLCHPGPPSAEEFARWALQSRITRLILGVLPEALILKGQPLAIQTLTSPARRWTGDIDVLILWEDLTQADDALKSLGYEPQASPRPWAYNQVTYQHPHWPIPVELHWRLALPSLPCPSVEDLFSRAQTLRLGAVDVPTLGPEDTVISLALHLAQHLGELRVAIDLAGYLDRSPVDLDRVRHLAREVGLARLVEIALQIADPDLDTHDPVAQIVSDQYWETWRAGVEFGDQKWAIFLAQCGTAAVLDEHQTTAFLRSVFLGPHRLGNVLGQITQRNSKN